MRKALLVATAATGVALVLLTSAISDRISEQKISKHRQKLETLAFCEKAYEIASSFPSYASTKAITVDERLRFETQSSYFASRHQHLASILEYPMRVEATKLGVPTTMYDSLLSTVRANAERKAIKAFQATTNPNDVIRRLNGLCNSYFK